MTKERKELGENRCNGLTPRAALLNPDGRTMPDSPSHRHLVERTGYRYHKLPQYIRDNLMDDYTRDGGRADASAGTLQHSLSGSRSEVCLC